MVKKPAFISLAVVLGLTMVTVASAANVAGTSKKGSLLVFPKIEVFFDAAEGTPIIDTYVSIGNDQSAAVSVKCYWMDNNQTIDDFEFNLTANQPVFFTASQYSASDWVAAGNVEVPPFRGIGSLVCFAVTREGDNQLKWNHLYGSATIVTIPTFDTPYAAQYNAYSFAVPGAVGGTPGQLDLNGSATAGYDACPQYLVANFYPAALWFGMPPFPPMGMWRPDLTLWPCRQDLRQDRTPTCTKAKFDVWNGNEIKFTGAYQCFKCFFEGFLDDMGTDDTNTDLTKQLYPAPPKGYQRGPGFGWSHFIETTLRTDTARFRVQGVRSSVCDSGKTRGCLDSSGEAVNSVDTPLLGVLLYGYAFGLDPVTNDQIVMPVAGSALFGAGTGDGATRGGPGFVKWDIAGNVVEVPAQ